MQRKGVSCQIHGVITATLLQIKLFKSVGFVVVNIAHSACMLCLCTLLHDRRIFHLHYIHKILVHTRMYISKHKLVQAEGDKNIFFVIFFDDFFHTFLAFLL